MSKVVNEPKHKNALLQAVRAQLEHRAHWLYLLCDEAGKRGLEWEDFGSAAVKRCGLSQGADLVKKGKTDSLKGLKKTLFTKPAQWVFEMDIKESTDDTLFIDRMDGSTEMVVSRNICRIEWEIIGNGVKYTAYELTATGNEKVMFAGYACKRGR